MKEHIYKIKKKPYYIFSIGMLINIIIGFSIISLPFMQKTNISPIDNLFTIVSAISTTGLSTIDIGTHYTFWGQLLLLIMFQIGGWGYMTITSFLFIVVKKDINIERKEVLTRVYVLPEGFKVKNFILNLVMFTIIIEFISSITLSILLWSAGDKNPIWSGIFHSISAFMTAGFSLYTNSFANFSSNIPVNILLSIISYLGAIGFIVLQDLLYSLKYNKKITFTSKIILSVSFIIFIIGAILFFFLEPSIQNMPLKHKLCTTIFQIASASTTTGFSTINISIFTKSVMFLIIIIMVIGASPSGTGGGIKTTTVSAIFAVITSIGKKSNKIFLFGREIPIQRVLTAVASASIYIICLTIGIFLLTITENTSFEKIFFETASAIGTVGLSIGLTPCLSIYGKIIITILMYIGRIGPLTLGMILFNHADSINYIKDDIAV